MPTKHPEWILALLVYRQTLLYTVTHSGHAFDRYFFLLSIWKVWNIFCCNTNSSLHIHLQCLSLEGLRWLHDIDIKTQTLVCSSYTHPLSIAWRSQGAEINMEMNSTETQNMSLHKPRPAPFCLPVIRDFHRAEMDSVETQNMSLHKLHPLLFSNPHHSDCTHIIWKGNRSKRQTQYLFDSFALDWSTPVACVFLTAKHCSCTVHGL